jgi:hypothetical protein
LLHLKLFYTKLFPWIRAKIKLELKKILLNFRLLKILQESEESDCFPSGTTSDHDSIASLPQTGGVAVERKLSFRSIKSSGRESDGDSIKSSPPVMRRPQSQYPNANTAQATATKKLMNLSLQSCFDTAIPGITPSSSELSTPSSPGYLDYTQFGSLERRKRLSTPSTPSSLSRYIPPKYEKFSKQLVSFYCCFVINLASTLENSMNLRFQNVGWRS